MNLKHQREGTIQIRVAVSGYNTLKVKLIKTSPFFMSNSTRCSFYRVKNVAEINKNYIKS